jgi:hypothetical protein
MQRLSRAWFGFTLLAVAVQLCASNMLAAQTAAPIQSSGQTPQTIVLPEEIPAGESATLAVLDSEGRIVPGAAVQLSSGARVTTDSTGGALFLAPPQGQTLTARLQTGQSFTTNVTGGTWREEPPSAAKPPTVRSPGVVALGDRLTLSGRGFHPDADRNRVVLGGELALVLASSSVSLVALPNPRTPLGNTELSIEVAGRNVVRAPVVVVSLAVTGPTTALGKGKKGVVQVAVSGTKEKLLVEVRNLSPDVVRFPRGDAVQLKTSGGATNIAKIEVVGVNPGDYAVSARFVEEAEGAR